MSESEISSAIWKLIGENSVVELRGYKSIHDFTDRNEDLIHAKMKWWQGLEALGAIRGLEGSPTVSASKMKKLMAKVYDFVEKKKYIAYEMLQLEGVSAHAWLVTQIKPLYENVIQTGYELSIIDSNLPSETVQYVYRYGDTHFYDMYYGYFTPYLQWKSSLKRYLSDIYHYCSPTAARAQFLKNLEKAGDQVVMTTEDKKTVTGTALARQLRASFGPVPMDVAKDYTFSDEEFTNLDWRSLSSGFGKGNTPEHRVE
jgi:hypothetical protein